MFLNKQIYAAMKGLALPLTVSFGFTIPAHAVLTLTATGIADGFTLSTFASGDFNYNHLATAVLPDGNLVSVDFANGALRKYPDVDGQTIGSAIASVSRPGIVNVASVGGHTYAATQGFGYFEVSSSLVLTPLSVTPGVGQTWGFWGNQVTGHLLAAAGTQIVDINPIAGTSAVVATTGTIDGVSVSPDGTTVYAEINNNQIVGYNILSHALVFDSGILGRGPDGTGVIATGAFAGYVVINNNDGTVALMNPTASSYDIIASGGARGDFTSPDLNNGTLFLATTDTTYRLGIIGGSFGPQVPEPGTLALLGTGLIGLAAARRKRAAKAA